MAEPGLNADSSDPKIAVYFITPHHLSALWEIIKVPLLRTHHTNSAKQSLLRPEFLDGQVQSAQKRVRISETNPSWKNRFTIKVAPCITRERNDSLVMFRNPDH